jgi:phosphonate metabolism protein PhnN/1,5-bisphosphokinase (PRPP-forming)
MSDAPRGRLVLVFGPSGAGKDSVLEAAAASPAAERLVFCRREITRPADAGGEAHVPVTWPEFAARRAAGAYLLAWEANGNGYGIPAHCAADLVAGRVVVASVSRTVLAAAGTLGVPVTALRITAPVAVLAERLARRGRESEAEIAARLARAPMPEPASGIAIAEIVNDGPLQQAVARFLALVQPPNA